MASVLAQVDNDLTLRVPQFFCCNCGEAEDVRPVATPLSKGHILKPGSRLALQLELPYCKRCVRSATQRPVGRIKKVLVSTILAVSAGVVAMITPLTSFVGAWVFFLVAVPVFAMIFVSYALQKPKGKQTSYQQPVRIAYVKRAASGKVSALTLAFSHARYGQAFAGANKEEVERGVLGVEEG